MYVVIFYEHSLLIFVSPALPTVVRAQCNFVLTLGKMIRQLVTELIRYHILAAALSDSIAAAGLCPIDRLQPIGKRRVAVLELRGWHVNSQQTTNSVQLVFGLLHSVCRHHVHSDRRLRHTTCRKL